MNGSRTANVLARVSAVRDQSSVNVELVVDDGGLVTPSPTEVLDGISLLNRHADVAGEQHAHAQPELLYPWAGTRRRGPHLGSHRDGLGIFFCPTAVRRGVRPVVKARQVSEDGRGGNEATNDWKGKGREKRVVGGGKRKIGREKSGCQGVRLERQPTTQECLVGFVGRDETAKQR